MMHLISITPIEFQAFEKDDLSFVFVREDRPFRVDDEVILELTDEAKQIKGIISRIWTNKETNGLKKNYLCLAVKVKKDQ